MFSSKTAICMVLATAATLACIACIAPTNALVHGRDDVDSVDVDSVRARRDVKAAKGAKAGKVISAKLAKAPKAPKAPKTTAAPDQQARDAAKGVIKLALNNTLVDLALMSDVEKTAFAALLKKDILALNSGLSPADIDSIVLEAVSRRGRARRAAVAVNVVITFSINADPAEIAVLVTAMETNSTTWVSDETKGATVGGQTVTWDFQAPDYTAPVAPDTTTAAPTAAAVSETVLNIDFDTLSEDEKFQIQQQIMAQNVASAGGAFVEDDIAEVRLVETATGTTKVVIVFKAGAVTETSLAAVAKTITALPAADKAITVGDVTVQPEDPVVAMNKAATTTPAAAPDTTTAAAPDTTTAAPDTTTAAPDTTTAAPDTTTAAQAE